MRGCRFPLTSVVAAMMPAGAGSCCRSAGAAGSGGGPGSAYRPGPILARKPRRVHSASWVSMLRGAMPSRAARSRPAQSRQGWLVMMRVTWSSSGVGPGLAGTGRLVLATAGTGGGPVRGRGDDGDLHPGDPGGQLGPVLVADVVREVKHFTFRAL